MTLDPRFITTVNLEPYFVDKITGAPLANGTIEFWKDNARSVPKPVYQLTGSPPNYTYTALPNPVTISSVGTIEDSLRNNVALYYFPYTSMDDNADIELYYVVVKDESGEEQFTREAWPNLTAEDDPSIDQNNVIVNQLSNPQFVEVLFDPTTGLSYSFTGSATDTISIAPDWDMIVQHTGTGTVTVTRNAIAGSSQYPTNPPYTMTFVAGTNISALTLRQRLPHNPSIWSPASGGVNGYIGANIVLEANSAVSMYYAPSSGAQQQILNESNSTGAPFEYSTVTQLSAASNPNTGNIGYVDILIDLAPAGTTTLTSVQIVGLESEDTGVHFNQAPVNRQEDQLFHYYSPKLQAKPIESYLVGWDFPVNPAQLLGASVSAFATGVNTSNYVWDQTIVFQTATSGASFSRTSAQAFRITAAATTQVALVQYVDLPTARELLNGRLSVNVAAKTSITGGLTGTVSLWYTSDASLPDMNTNVSLIATLDANGKPATLNGAFLEVPRPNFTSAKFVVRPNATTGFNDYSFSGWDLAGDAAVETTNFVAIVVGFASMSAADTIDISSISLVPGDIPTRPAPKTADEVLFQCERFYKKSYESSVLPGTTFSPEGSLYVTQSSTLYIGSTPSTIKGLIGSFSIEFGNEMRTAAPVITLYTPNGGVSNSVFMNMIFNGGAGPTGGASSGAVAISNWSKTTSTKGVLYIAGGNSSGVAITALNTFDQFIPAQVDINFHYVADARLGIV